MYSVESDDYISIKVNCAHPFGYPCSAKGSKEGRRCFPLRMYFLARLRTPTNNSLSRPPAILYWQNLVETLRVQKHAMRSHINAQWSRRPWRYPSRCFGTRTLFGRAFDLNIFVHFYGVRVTLMLGYNESNAGLWW